MPGKASTSTYLRYIIPTTLSFLVVGTYSIVDGLFVGQKVGDVGLASINIAYPLICLVMAVGTGIGMGGGVISSIERGLGNEDSSRRVIGHTFTLLCIAGVLLSLVLFAVSWPLLSLIGGRGPTLEGAYLYFTIYLCGALFQVFVSGGIPLLRNKGAVSYAMFASVTSLIANIFMDWLFIIVLDGGLVGAAIATVLAQFIGFLFVLVFFVRKRNRPQRSDMKLRLDTVSRTLKCGLAPCGLTLLPEVATVVMNIQCAEYGGQAAVAAWAVIAYVGCAVQFIIQGISDGTQPLMSLYYGKGDEHTVSAIRRTNYAVNVSIGVVGAIVLYVLRQPIIDVFGVSPEAAAIIMIGFPLFSFAFPLFGVTHASTSYFYATETTRSALVLVLAEIALIIPSGIILPLVGGLTMVWLVEPVTQAALGCIAIGLLVTARRKQPAEARA